MEIQELRFGNIVNYKHDSLDKDIDMDVRLFRIMEANPKRFNPIILTEDWLLCFGFEKFKEYNIFSKGESLQIDKAPDNDGMWWFFVGSDNRTDTPYCVEVKHVHQLQNLYFALEQEELMIKETA